MVAWYANSSPAFSGNRVVRMAAIRENRSSHWEMSVTGSRAGASGRPEPWRSSSTVTSAISTNSMSRIRFTTLAGRNAAGLNGPGFVSRASAAGELTRVGRAGGRPSRACGARGGLVPLGGARGGLVAERSLAAAAASRCRPATAGSGVNSGRRGRVATSGGPDGVGIVPAAWTGGIVVVNDHALCPGPHT